MQIAMEPAIAIASYAESYAERLQALPRLVEVLSSPTVCAMHCEVNQGDAGVRLQVGLLVVATEQLPVMAGAVVTLAEIPLVDLTRPGVKVQVQLPAIRATVSSDVVLTVVDVWTDV